MGFFTQRNLLSKVFIRAFLALLVAGIYPSALLATTTASFLGSVLVITSYSIHYTKLYDGRHLLPAAGWTFWRRVASE